MASTIIDQDIVERPEVAQPLRGEVVLSVEHVSKKFCRSLKRSLFYGAQDIGTELIGAHRQSAALRPGEFWALKDVSLQLRRGEALGLVGPNGSGKTTLLRIISGLIKPDTGLVRVKGRVAPLIALGAGFNPVLTGRENVYVNMSILGLSVKQIDERFSEVERFAEIGDAIDAPVQTYSSGMAARLGFACAVHTEPDILLIDEVLAVGDIKFRTKCYRRIADLREQGTSIVLVAHNSQLVLYICESAVYLMKGELIAEGDTHSVVNRYEEDVFVNETEEFVGSMLLPEKPKHESLGVDIVSLSFKDDQGNTLQAPITGETAYFCIRGKAHRKIAFADIGVAITALSGEGRRVLDLTSATDNQRLEIPPGDLEIQMQMPNCSLRPGLYSAKVCVAENMLCFLDTVESFKFSVKGTKSMKQSLRQSLFYQPHAWKIISK